MSNGGLNYRVLSVIGEGGFGRVYRARMETGGFHKDVALKVLSDPEPPRSLLQRFRDEAKILGLIRDRAIVGVEPPIQIGGKWAVVMEYVDGASCGALLNVGPVPPGVAVEIVGEVARALHHAFHMEGPEGEPLQLLHRDVKPDNIQLTPAGEVRLLDFGIARANFAAREFKTRASFGGTPGYIAPERTQGIELPVGDVFSLGVVLHEIVTGVKPRFAATVDLDSETDHLATELDVLPSFLADKSVAAVLRLAGWMRCVEPEGRPSARQVEEACRSLRQTLPAPYYRDWAEANVPHRIELPPDELVGQVLPSTLGTLVPVSQASLPPAPMTDGGSRRFALGALLGGGAAFAAAAVVGVLLTAGVLIGWWATRQGATVVPPVEPVVEAPVPQVVDGVEPEPVATPTPEPAVVVVAPQVRPGPPRGGEETPPAQPTKVIPVVVEPENPGPAPAPVPTPPPAPTGRTGFVVVRTVPSGAEVLERGTVLERTGRGYELPVGRHLLTIRSTNGEETTVPAVVSGDRAFTVCYSFDTNSGCTTDEP